jgi:hypothetical protein
VKRCSVSRYNVVAVRVGDTATTISTKAPLSLSTANHIRVTVGNELTAEWMTCHIRQWRGEPTQIPDLTKQGFLRRGRAGAPARSGGALLTAVIAQ